MRHDRHTVVRSAAMNVALSRRRRSTTPTTCPGHNRLARHHRCAGTRATPRYRAPRPHRAQTTPGDHRPASQPYSAPAETPDHALPVDNPWPSTHSSRAAGQALTPTHHSATATEWLVYVH